MEQTSCAICYDNQDKMLSCSSCHKNECIKCILNAYQYQNEKIQQNLFTDAIEDPYFSKIHIFSVKC